MLVFDLDDTLYLEREFAFSGFEVVADFFEAQFAVTGAALTCRDLFHSNNRSRVFNQLCIQNDINPTQDLIAEMVDLYRFHMPRISLCPDAAVFLQKQKGQQGMALITDGPEKMQRNKIAALGLAPYLDHIRPTGAWPVGFGKPHARAFAEVEALGHAPADLVYIADNPAKDFVTPKARGWHTIQISRPGAVHDPIAPDEAHQADRQIATFHALEGVLRM